MAVASAALASSSALFKASSVPSGFIYCLLCAAAVAALEFCDFVLVHRNKAYVA